VHDPRVSHVASTETKGKIRLRSALIVPVVFCAVITAGLFVSRSRLARLLRKTECEWRAAVPGLPRSRRAPLAVSQSPGARGGGGL